MTLRIVELTNALGEITYRLEKKFLSIWLPIITSRHLEVAKNQIKEEIENFLKNKEKIDGEKKIRIIMRKIIVE
jgi:hypothetical protein